MPFFWGNVSFFFGSSISSFCNSLECNSVGDLFERLVILSAILLPIESPVASAVFLIALFEAVCSSTSVVFCLALSRSFWPHFYLNLLIMFLVKDKNL